MGDIGTCVRNLCGICMGYDGTMHDTMVAIIIDDKPMIYHDINYDGHGVSSSIGN